MRVNRSKLKIIIAKLKKRRKKIVFTNGCFDILHYGHIKYLEKCRKLGDVLVVGLNSDISVKKIKGKKRPIVGEKERAAILSALEFVHFVVLFNERTPEKLIEWLSPDVLAKGGDWRARGIVGGNYVKESGGRVVAIPFVRGYSTTGIIKRIRNA